MRRVPEFEDPIEVARFGRSRVPRHVGFIPDGNRRWALARGLQKGAGYLAGIEPGLRLLEICRGLGIQEVTAYGFTKENVRRPTAEVEAFRSACAEFGLRAVEHGAALLALGDATSRVFPEALRPFSHDRSPGTIRFNLLVNYGWRWDLEAGRRGSESAADGRDATHALGSHQVSRIDLVVRWGGRSRLSGFLPIQCAYADLFIVDALWPDMRPDEFNEALRWYRTQEITLGG